MHPFSHFSYHIPLRYNNVYDFPILLLRHHIPHEASHRSNCSNLVFGPLNRKNLHSSRDGHKPASPPSERGGADLSTNTVKISCKRWCNGTASSARRRREPIDFTQNRSQWCGFFEQDEEDGIGEDGGEVSNRDAGIDAEVERVIGDES